MAQAKAAATLFTMARMDASLPGLFTVRTFAEYATPEQKARFLPDLLAGRGVISLGMSEPEAGSAVTDLSTTARLDGSGYVIDGTKVFSTHSPDASVFLIYVRFGPGV